MYLFLWCSHGIGKVLDLPSRFILHESNWLLRNKDRLCPLQLNEKIQQLWSAERMVGGTQTLKETQCPSFFSRPLTLPLLLSAADPFQIVLFSQRASSVSPSSFDHLTIRLKPRTKPKKGRRNCGRSLKIPSF